MNSSAANMNVSALLNLGANAKVDRRDLDARDSDETFKKHMANSASEANESSVAASNTNSEASDKRRDDKHGGDRGQEAKDQVKPKAESSDADTSTEGSVQSQHQEKTNSVEPSSEASTASEESGASVSSRDQDTSSTDESAEFTPLVSSLAETSDSGTEASSEVIIDVPGDASISLESLADAVANTRSLQDQESETHNTALDELVEDIIPVASTAAPTAAPAASEQAAMASVAVSPAVGNSAVGTRQSFTSFQDTTGAVTAEEGDSLATALEGRSAGSEAKSGASKTVELMQLAENMPRPNQQTLNQQAASAVNLATQEMAKDGSLKSDASGSLREVSPLIATTQRPASRPINVQQGSAQFTMPNQAKAGQPQWQTAVAERVAIMATQRITSAEIQLDPPELGQLQVRVTLNQEQASVSFASQHAVVREALDQTAQKLRDMFDAEGLNLVDVDVSDQSFQQQAESGNGGSGQSDAAGEHDEDAEEIAPIKIAQGLVDHFV
ncbi:MAG: flagellar hook-length control protein FliK [Cellvibrionaceae bacterium]